MSETPIDEIILVGSELPPGAVAANGKIYMRDARGSLVPIELVKQQDRLQDDLVRALYARAREVSELLAAFKENAFTQLDEFGELLASEYDAPFGGKKGNATPMTFDGLLKIQVQVADQITFGPELQVAKALVDECLGEWSADSRGEIRRLVMDAFDVDREGAINRGKLFSLLRLEITDERWQRAMKAIRDSIRVMGTKRYLRFYHRADCQSAWESLSLDLATA